MKLRYSLISIFAFIIFAAIFSLALSDPASLWSDVCITVTMFVLAAILARVFACRVRHTRIAAAGAAIFGIAYFVLIFNGVFFLSMCDHLPTSLALSLFHDAVHGPVEPNDPQTVEAWMRQGRPVGNEGAEPRLPIWPPAEFDQYSSSGSSGLVAFSQVGHCVFALILALLGGAYAYYMSRAFGAHDS